MTTSFDQWEKDPFFSAAKEVQESADRMESTYRTWIHGTKDTSRLWNCDELERDLRTTLGTTKWQLEEFERAVKSSYIKRSNEDIRNMHREFIEAIEDQIQKIEKSLQKCDQSKGKSSMPWVRLDEGENNELALFLSGPPTGEDKIVLNNVARDNKNPQAKDEESAPDCSSNSIQSADRGSHNNRDEKSHGHRRTASASADLGSWKIAISGVDFKSPKAQPQQPFRKIPSLSGFLSTVESASKFKWPKNGFRKLKVEDRHQETNSPLLPPPQSSRSTIAGLDRNKSCLDSCDDFYDKQLYGWSGSIQRQLQRSLYQMQYSRPVQVTFSTIFILMIVLVTMSVL